jgi:hypothetical protein
MQGKLCYLQSSGKASNASELAERSFSEKDFQANTNKH